MEKIHIPWFLSTDHALTSAETQLQEVDHMHIHEKYPLQTQTFAHEHTYTDTHDVQRKTRFKCIFVQPMMKCIPCYGKDVLCYIE